MDKISIVLPVYNGDKYLEECLNSIQNQSYKNFEVLMIDDFSNDSSAEILQKYEQRDPRFIYKRNLKNEGLSVSRNNGIQYSNGDLLFFVDADDVLDENCLNELFVLLKKYDADVSICGFEMFVDIICPHTKSSCALVYSNDELMREVTLCDKIQNFAWGKLFKKDIFDGVIFPPRRYYEDVNTIPLVLSRAKICVFLEAPLYFYRQNPDSISKKMNSKKICDFFMSTKEKSELILSNYPHLLKNMRNSFFNLFMLRKNNKVNKTEIKEYESLKKIYKLSIKGAPIKDKLKYLIATL